MPALRQTPAPVRRRAWGEVGVRPWTALALVMLLAALILAGVRFGAWRRETRVVENGTPVTAEVIYVGVSLAREGSRDEGLLVNLRYTPPGSNTPLDVWGDLPRKPGAMASTKVPILVRIDPAHPDYWTERTTPPPFGLAMVVPLLCLVVAAGCALIAVWKRAGVLRAFRAGDVRRATVTAVRQSPLAPFSKLLSVTTDDPADRRVRTCYWPGRCGPIHPGREIEVIAAGPRVLASDAYHAPAPLVPAPGVPGDAA